MKAMQCELCGSTDILKDGDYFVCQNCGTKYTPENAKKMMVEGVVQVEGTVKVDASTLTANYLELGNKAYAAQNFTEAESYANKVLEHDSDNFEAWLLKGQATAWQSKLKQQRINEAISCFVHAVEHAPEDKLEEVKTFIQKESSLEICALLDLAFKAVTLHPLYDDAVSVYLQLIESTTACTLQMIQIGILPSSDIILHESHSGHAASKAHNARMKEYSSNIAKATETTKKFGASSDWLRSQLASAKEEYLKSLPAVEKLAKAAVLIFTRSKDLVPDLLKNQVFIANVYIAYDTLTSICNSRIENGSGTATEKENLYQAACEYYNKSLEVLELCPELKSQFQSQTPVKPVSQTANDSGGCYVATAVYGSYDCPQVWTLRRYRDFELAESFWGRVFIKTYYAISPTLVRWFGDTDWFKRMWRGKLDRMVADLQARGFSSAPYKDRSW